MDHSELGKKSIYSDQYDASLLFPIARTVNRSKIGITKELPFVGRDVWNHYEVSWLDPQGKPIVALAEFSYDCASPNIIESKSMKLYFNSFNNTQIENVAAIERMIQRDIETRIESPLCIRITPVGQFAKEALYPHLIGSCIDDLAVTCSEYQINPTLLSVGSTVVCETLSSNLMKSNCMVTGQPDWGSVSIQYRGKAISQEGLLRYIVSYRHAHEFSETCIERMFVDIMKYCNPDELTIYGRFTRRGGIDINPIRSTSVSNISQISNFRLCRQ